jgi:hypothetical protein
MLPAGTVKIRLWGLPDACELRTPRSHSGAIKGGLHIHLHGLAVGEQADVIRQLGMNKQSVQAAMSRTRADGSRPWPEPEASELTTAIGAFIDHRNQHPRPFAWTKDADEILGKIERAKTKAKALTDH